MATHTAARPMLEAPGFPRDTPGRVLLLTVIGLAADLLAPWSNVYGQRQAMIHIGAPAWGLVALFALAALPLAGPSFRREPLVGALPMLVGAFCAGIGALYWLLLFRENEQASAIPASVPVGAIGVQDISTGPGVVIAPDIGLFLFLLGSVVLAIVGYQLLLAAAVSGRAASVGSAVEATGRPGAAASASGSVSASAPVVALASATAGAAERAGAGVGQTLAELNGHTAQHGQNEQHEQHGQNEQHGYAPAAQTLSGTGAGSGAQSDTGPAEPWGGAGGHVVLPGSAAWNEAPQQPDVKRHVGGGGWQRPRGRLR